MKNKTNFSTIKVVLSYLKRYWFLIIVSLLFATISVLLSLSIPIFIGEGIDLLSEDTVEINKIINILVIVGIIALASAILQWAMNGINNRITYNVTRDIRNKAFDKIHTLPLAYIDSHPSGETVNKIISDVDQFADGLLMGFTQFFTGIVTILATLGIMFYLNWKIALVVVLLTPLSLFVASFISKSSYSLFHKQSVTKAKQTAVVNEVISNLKAVKAFSREDEELERFDKVNEELKKTSTRAIFFSSLVNPTTRFVNALVYAGVALVGALLVIKAGGNEGALSVGVLSCFLSYATQYAKPFNEISGVVTELQNALACAKRVFDFTNEAEEISDKENSELIVSGGSVTLSDVSFSYTKERELIKGLSLEVESGMHVAIVGPTGCGKTTLINLLMRFYDVDSGEIKIDGQNIKDVTRDSLRGSYGMVLQETWLQNASVRDNVALGKPDATLEEIIEACKASHAHSFIKRLPNGYDTIISDEGSSLSQGQKQLLCIARIMLALPPMLILDEATSSIDTRTEIKIQNAFSKLMKGRTSFIVAHRLSTIKEADVILVMKDGSIIEIGNHEQLLDKGGFYASLYNSQFEPSEENKNA
ncbi:MAG: ABC transporter ATP-binding protein [Clostridia bacterium]|nr:ABC transporter ATP-binding protein [Clostridia bacterium]